MNLHEEIRSFVDWMQTHALRGFREYTTDNYSDDYNTLEDVLLSIAADMKNAVRCGDKIIFAELKGLYVQYFSTINEELARTHYADLLDELLDSNLSNIDAQVMAVSELWKNPLYREYLDVTVHLTSDTTGETLYLVGSHAHAKGRHPYVIAEEIEMLKSKFMDPWEYVRNREVQDEQLKRISIN